MTAPGAIMMSKMIVPETEQPETGGDVIIEVPKQDVNVIDAAGRGAIEGLHLSLNVAGMLIAFVALVALVALANGILSGIGGWFGAKDLTFQKILGYPFAPLMYMLNVPWSEAQTAGGLLGEKVVLNEFVAFISLSKLTTLSPMTTAIVTFALCGFANFSSIAIQMAVTGGLAPNQRPVIARLGIKALIAGTLSNLMSAALAGMMLVAQGG
jgi:CNT family concentrative nucleoside transporter